MREILDVMGDETHRDVVVAKPAQCGYTEALNQFVAFSMAEDPSGVIVIQPDIERAKSWMKERVDPMLAESPRLQGIVRSENGRRTSDDTMQRKVFPGGYLVAVGANSPSGLRSRPARRLIGDERSGWTLDARQHGDTWDLGCERTSTFWNAKRIQGSTPGEEGTCPITTALAHSDWREYHVKCPACSFSSPFQWRAEDGTYRLVCDRDAADALIPQTARYLCVACGVLIPESEKARMVRGGEWIARYPDREAAGFDLGNSLMSPWRSWPDLMALWTRAQGNHERLKVFVTHVLNQPWKATAERVEAHTLMSRVEVLESAPPTVALLTGAVDVQNNRLETLVCGWAEGEEGFVFQWGQHDGDPHAETTWADAWNALHAPLGARLMAIAIDTGYLTDIAWKHVDAWQSRGGVRVFGTKGMPGRPRPIMARPAVSSSRRVRHPWMVGTDAAKDALALRLRQPVPPGGPGALHFAESLPSAFFEGLTSEALRPAIVAGRPTKVWRVRAGMANEPLDLTILCLAALHGLGVRTVAQLGALATRREGKRATEPQAVGPNAEEAPAPRHAPTRPRSKWWERKVRGNGFVWGR
jgi:phage terminase large subunit GpA-like protein